MPEIPYFARQYFKYLALGYHELIASIEAHQDNKRNKRSRK